MGRFALLGLLLTGTALALATGADGGGNEAAGDRGADAAGERLVLAVVGNERSASAVHGERAVVADPRTGELNSFVLPGGTLCHGPLMAVGHRVVFSGYRGSRAFAMSLPLTLRGEPASLGRADTITPSARPGKVWLGRWHHDGKRTRATFREVAIPGEEATSRAAGRSSNSAADGVPRDAGASRAGGEPLAVRLPRWSLIHAALPGGFVIEHRSGLALWDGDRARPLRGGRRAWPVATGSSSFAWCREPCRRVRVLTPAGERTLTTPPHLLPQLGSGGAFSPDGSLLALPVTHERRPHAAVVDLRTREWSVIAGGRLALYGAMAWSRSANRLYLATAGGGLRAWEPGAARAVRLPVEPGGTVMSIATTP